MVLDDLLDLGLDLGRNRTLGDLLEETAVRGREVTAELSLPASDLVDGDGVELSNGVRAGVATESPNQPGLTRPLTPA